MLVMVHLPPNSKLEILTLFPVWIIKNLGNYVSFLTHFPDFFLYIYGADSKVLKFNKVHMRTYRRSGLLISNKLWGDLDKILFLEITILSSHYYSSLNFTPLSFSFLIIPTPIPSSFFSSFSVKHSIISLLYNSTSTNLFNYFCLSAFIS